MRSRAWNPLALARDAVRNSPWIAMAVALHLIVIAIATVMVTKSDAPRDDGQEITLDVQRRPQVVEEPIEIVDTIVRRQIPVNDDVEIVEPKEWVPPSFTSDTPVEDAGDPNSMSDVTTGDVSDASGSIGPGKDGKRGGGVTAYPGRGPIGKIKRGPGPGGPNEETEEAVLNGMRWLARHQNPDGSWGALSLRERCTSDAGCASLHANATDHYDVGLTGMALLTFLGAGYSHASQQKITDPVTRETWRVGDIVSRGLKWLVAKQSPDGSLSGPRVHMYNEALATMALCEAYGLTRHRAWREPAQRAAHFLAQAQRPSPADDGLWGWRYAPRQEIEDQRVETGDTTAYRRELSDSDTSVTAWALMALKSARLSGIEVDEAHFRGATSFVRWASAEDGLVGYLDPRGAGAKVTGPDDHFDYHPAGMSALGMCVRIFAEHDPADPFHELAAKRLVADLPKPGAGRLGIDYYYWYYGSLALNQFDGPDSPRKSGKYWNAWNKAMVEAVVELQETSTKSCRHGGWMVRDRWWHSGGPIYATALNVLTLEVYYRYANAFGTARTPGVEPSKR